MTILELIDGLGLVLHCGDANIDLSGVTDDSRQVSPGFAFIARRGAEADGAAFIRDAVERGAVAVICEHGCTAAAMGYEAASGGRIAAVHAGQVDHVMTGRLAERFFGDPSRRLTLIGVTGTNGKTTTALLIQHLLRDAGVACGLIGTIFADNGRHRSPAGLTTPGPVELSRLLADMVTHGCKAAVVEVSSHALDQGRTAGLAFNVGVFTNLTGDHLDYHGNMDDYASAKAKLFEQLPCDGWAVVNADDSFAPRLLRDCDARIMDCMTCVVGQQRNVTSDVAANACVATVLELARDHTVAQFAGPWGDVQVRLPLVGRFNVTNTLQALAATCAVTDLSRTVRKSLELAPRVPGRLEPVAPPLTPPVDASTVLVDYAHTDDALGNVLHSLRPVTTGRLMVMFGCGGDRDRTKRPRMAAVACELADVVYITSDNPRTECPQAIIDEILTGVPAETRDRVLVEVDRAKAIAMAIRDAQPDDVVLLAGKGHEDYQIIGTHKRYFNDRDHAAAALHDHVATR
jgi:UDP-N-acetylmuramoyl-L-alanyl-D-glutamate--2,6-diaminopimelate ligase